MYYVYYRMDNGLHIDGGTNGIYVWRSFLTALENHSIVKCWFTYERKEGEAQNAIR